MDEPEFSVMAITGESGEAYSEAATRDARYFLSRLMDLGGTRRTQLTEGITEMLASYMLTSYSNPNIGCLPGSIADKVRSALDARKGEPEAMDAMVP